MNEPLNDKAWLSLINDDRRLLREQLNTLCHEELGHSLVGFIERWESEIYKPGVSAKVDHIRRLCPDLFFRGEPV